MDRLPEWERLLATERHLQHFVPGTVLPLPRFWLAALADLGEPVDLAAAVPDYYEQTAP